MRRTQVQSLAEALTDYLRDSGLEKPILERQVVELWPQVMGETVARLTRKVEMEQGVLKVWLSNAALRAQLFDCRFDLVRKMNEAVNGDVIRDVRLM